MKLSTLWRTLIIATVTPGSVTSLIFRGPIPALVCSASIAAKIIPAAL